MRASLAEVVLQMCYKDFFSSLQILGCLPLHCLPSILVWVHCKTVQLYQTPVKKTKEKYYSCVSRLNLTDKTLSSPNLGPYLLVKRELPNDTVGENVWKARKAVVNFWFVTSCFYSGPHDPITCLAQTCPLKFPIDSSTEP